MTTSAHQTPEGWLPVEHRLLGLDRRQLKPALFALIVALVLIYGFQALNAAIPWNNPTKAGDVLDLGDGATAVPPTGWQLEDGTLVSQESAPSASRASATLATGGAVLHVQGATFEGSANAFLDQVLSVQDDDSRISGPRASFTTDAGLVGVVESGSGPRGDILFAAFKLATGSTAAIEAAPALLVQVETAPGQFEQRSDAIGAFLRSIAPGERG